MRKITRSDILDIAQYERVREDFRRRIIQLKSRRRVSVGPWVTVVFENRDTVLFQIEEMMRVERIVHDDRIQHEIDTYNSLVPEAGELRATLFIEVEQEPDMKPVLDSHMGIDHGETVWLKFGDERVVAEFERGRSNEEQISAVHFLTFRFTADQARRFSSREDEVFLVLNHGDRREGVRLSGETVASLAQDLVG
jgi:hypothetical protein